MSSVYETRLQAALADLSTRPPRSLSETAYKFGVKRTTLQSH